MSIQQKNLDENPYLERIIQQTETYSDRLKQPLTCPITNDLFDTPYITPCGHTFEYSAICQWLAYKKQCPLDLKPLQIEDLTPNTIAKEMVSSLIKTKKFMPIFLTFRGENSYPHKCMISKKPLHDASKLPCGHVFDHTAITEWITNKECCPLENGNYKISDIVPCMVTRQIVQKTYPQYLEKVKKFNESLTSKVIDLQLDDRISLASHPRLSEIIKCPLSNSLMKSPVINHCGHTVDLDSIKGESAICPHHDHELTNSSKSINILKSKVVANRLAQDVLEVIKNMHTVIDHNILKKYEDKMGVFIFLDPTTSNLSRIGKIATILNLFTSPDQPTPNQVLRFVLIPSYRTLTDIKTPLSHSDELNIVYEKDIPTLIMV